MVAPLHAFLRRLSWALGFGAGLALMLMAVTGAFASYEEAVREWIDAASRW